MRGRLEGVCGAGVVGVVGWMSGGGGVVVRGRAEVGGRECDALRKKHSAFSGSHESLKQEVSAKQSSSRHGWGRGSGEGVREEEEVRV